MVPIRLVATSPTLPPRPRSQQALLDAYLCLMHLTAALVLEPLFYALLTAAAFLFSLFAVFQMRLLLLVWRAHRHHTAAVAAAAGLATAAAAAGAGGAHQRLLSSGDTTATSGGMDSSGGVWSTAGFHGTSLLAGALTGGGVDRSIGPVSLSAASSGNSSGLVSSWLLRRELPLMYVRFYGGLIGGACDCMGQVCPGSGRLVSALGRNGGRACLRFPRTTLS